MYAYCNRNINSLIQTLFYKLYVILDDSIYETIEMINMTRQPPKFDRPQTHWDKINKPQQMFKVVQRRKLWNKRIQSNQLFEDDESLEDHGQNNFEGQYSLHYEPTKDGETMHMPMNVEDGRLRRFVSHFTVKNIN